MTAPRKAPRQKYVIQDGYDYLVGDEQFVKEFFQEVLDNGDDPEMVEIYKLGELVPFTVERSITVELGG